MGTNLVPIVPFYALPQIPALSERRGDAFVLYSSYMRTAAGRIFTYFSTATAIASSMSSPVIVRRTLQQGLPHLEVQIVAESGARLVSSSAQQLSHSPNS